MLTPGEKKVYGEPLRLTVAELVDEMRREGLAKYAKRMEGEEALWQFGESCGWDREKVLDFVVEALKPSYEEEYWGWLRETRELAFDSGRVKDMAKIYHLAGIEVGLVKEAAQGMTRDEAVRLAEVWREKGLTKFADRLLNAGGDAARQAIVDEAQSFSPRLGSSTRIIAPCPSCPLKRDCPDKYCPANCAPLAAWSEKQPMRALVEAIRTDPAVGRGSCSTIDECMEDSEIIWDLAVRGITTPEAALKWAREEEGLEMEKALNQRWGEDDDPQLAMQAEFKAACDRNPL